MLGALPAASGCGGSDEADAVPAKLPYEGIGRKDDRAKVIERFTEVKEAFRDGDAEHVCATFGEDDEWTERCEREVSRTFEGRQRGEIDWQRRKVIWSRVYTPERPVGGVTTWGLETGTDPMRPLFEKRDGTWYSDFRIPGDLEAFNVR